MCKNKTITLFSIILLGMATLVVCARDRLSGISSKFLGNTETSGFKMHKRI